MLSKLPWNQHYVVVNEPFFSNTLVLDGILITIAYHGQELKGWYNRANLLKQWRQVVDRYANKFNLSVLHSDGLYLDLLDNMPTDIWQSALATLLCMAAICAVFMAEFCAVVVATLVIASIMLGSWHHRLRS